MTKFDSKSFNAEAFGEYVESIPNLKKNAIANSGALGSNEQARKALSSQTGSLYARIPYYGRISGSTSQNNDGNTDINSSNLSTYEQGFVVASRMDSWTERSFSKNITAGVDFMDHVGRQLSDYKLEVKQAIALAILSGIFSMPTSGSTGKAKAAKAFVENHTTDVTTIGTGCCDAVSLNNAIQKACGDNKNKFVMAVMHSTVSTNLENLKVLEYMKYTDENGIEQQIGIGTWNGRIVLIDDNVPTTEVEASGDVAAYTAYTTYVLAEGAIVLDDIGDAVPYEMSRDPGKNGGQDTLYVRDRYICGVDGISFEKPSSLTASASNEDLANGANWEVINDGTDYLPHKAIGIARIISKG